MGEEANKQKQSILGGNPIFCWLMICFIVMTCIIGSIACYYAYHQKQVEMLAKYDYRLLQFFEKYKDITDQFWEIYLPIYVQDDSSVLEFFDGSSESKRVDNKDLRYEMRSMSTQNQYIQWIAIYSPHQNRNYVYIVQNNTLKSLPSALLDWLSICSEDQRMQIIPEKKYKIDTIEYNSLVIIGGAPGRTGGRIAVGFDLNALREIGLSDDSARTLEYHIMFDNMMIFSTAAVMPNVESDAIRSGTNACLIEGEKYYINVSQEYLRGETVFYSIKWKELFWNAAKSTYLIVLLIILIASLSVAIYLIMLRSISKEVNVIRGGLRVLGENHLNYRILERFKYPELRSVAGAINRMAGSLEENIARAQEYEKQQKKAELQELQAKYNPHFLYNTLEYFRMRCYQNGDDETAELIRQAASFFRGYIDSKTFVPIHEELAFSKRYLGLFQGRYGDSIRVLYDIDSDVLQYGIIRNVFQPLIENYFEYGFNPEIENNYLLFRGYLCEEDAIVFEVEDNGRGIDDKSLHELNHNLQQPVVSAEESYGLRNLHQRIQLFYGEGFGLILKKRGENGVTVYIRVRRQRV